MVALLLLGACVPRAHLTMIEAADVALPDDLKTLGVVDRTDGRGDDAAAARAAVEGLVVFVQASPQLDALPGACGEGAQAVAVLEALSSEHDGELESGERVETDAEGQEVRVPTYTARLESRVRTTWSLATCDGTELDRLEDVLTVDTWTSTSDARETAEGDLPSPGRATEELGFSAGVAYGRRIAPSIDDVSRRYFVRGDPRLQAAHLAVRAGHWADAMASWRQVASTADSDRVRARALHDLAVGYEVLGNYRLALTYTEEAAATHDNGRIRRYRDLLRRIRAERRQLRRGEGRR